MPVSLIYARSENYCIGKDGGMPWRLPDDFRHFKRSTLGHPIIMGRKTYEDHSSALPGRLNIVVTRQPSYRAAPGVEVVGSLDEAIAAGQRVHERVFIIGGADFFARGLELADEVFETVVHAVVDGDVFIDAFDFSDWSTEVLTEHPADERHAYAFTVYHHRRDG